MYYIISKFEVINGVVKSTPIGYTSNSSEVDALNATNHGLNDYHIWLESEPNVSSIMSGTLSSTEYVTLHGAFNGCDAMCDFIPDNLQDLGDNIWL